MTDEYAPTQVVCMGRVELDGNTIGIKLITAKQLDTLIEAGAPADTISYAGSAFGFKGAPTGVGLTYEVEAMVDPDGRLTSYRPKTAKWVSTRPKPELATVWSANDKAISLKRRAAGQLAKAAEDEKLDNLLIELGWVYRNVAPSNREAFKLMVLGALKDPPGLAMNKLKDDVRRLQAINKAARKAIDKLNGKAKGGE